MARRGPYAKGAAMREKILEVALGVVAEVGYSNTTVRALAEAVGISTTAVLHYFGTKDDLFVEILRRRDLTDELGQLRSADSAEPTMPVLSGLADVLRHNTEIPGLVQLYTRLVAEATTEDHTAHGFFQHRYRVVRELIADSIRREQAAGLLDPTANADELAVVVVAVADGLQLQWLYDPEIAMGDGVATALRSLNRTSAEER